MTRREDLLISVCFAEAPTGAADQESLRAFAARLEAVWRYWEILIVSDAANTMKMEPLLADIPNLRILGTQGLSERYRRRVIGASEAIGDLVVLGAFEELDYIDIPAMLTEAAETGAVIVPRREERRILLDGMLSVLGSSSGFRIQARDLQTVVLQRTLLNRLLARADRQLALRFMPRDSGVPVRYSAISPGSGPPRAGGIWRRLGIVQKLLVHSAPSVLSWVSLLAILTVLGALSFTIYAICIWLFASEVQPGWFTTSLAISLTAFFLGVAIFGLASGLLKLIDLVTPEVLGDVVDERGNADLFARVVQDLNVETLQDERNTS